ncbi:hypothetical protein Y032_0097g2964 [Ancylostoma ceylanicum]|uniref:Uncharacterized protein n=1 Tax=Ancylostoma ceylanicum TaxID=53326 RepID=A0A016TJS5_9BILA|nr:hypothetical protein Y032_0097g2964 [Ancylostoma ceylanicum]
MSSTCHRPRTLFPSALRRYPPSQSCAGVQHISGTSTGAIPAPECKSEEGELPFKDHVPYVLSSQEKVNFLKKCCASPVLRFILHLLSDPRQENLVSWHGGPFGVKIWNTRKFTDCYNAAMGAKMNFTNISRALQACEHITIAGVRLWKRKKQGEYSFFPCYTGHGFPNIPPAAMPKDIPACFPFERRAAIKTPQTRLSSGYGHCSPPPDTSLLLPAVYYKQPPPYHILSPEQASPSTSHCIGYQPIPQYSTPLLSPSPSLSSFDRSSPAYSVTSPSLFPVPYGLLTPPPSDTSASSSSSDSFSFNDSLGAQAYSPEAVFLPPCDPLPCEDVVPEEVCAVGESNAEPTRAEEAPAQPHLDPSILDEFFSPIEAVQPRAPPAENVIAEQRELTDTPHPDGEDLFGNFSNIIGYDLSIDETSLLYH